MLMTEYGKKLDRETIPLSEYPRPQFVRDSYMCLNGIWQCEFSKQADIPSDYGFNILVPFSPETPLSGVQKKLKPGDYLHYRRTFTITKDFNKGRVFLHFDAVDQIAEVYVNSQHAGSHIGGYTPFEIEITDYITEGENVLNVVVQDFTDTKQYSRGKQSSVRGGIWYTAQSGIWQTVWLESTPKEFLKNVKITPDYDKESVSFEFEGTDDVITRIYDGEDMIAETTEKTVKIPDFKSWSPEDPFLYNVEFLSNGEKIKSYFAMRKFSIGVDDDGIKRLFLNNKPYFHNGLLDQGYYPDGFLTPPSAEAMENDIKNVKKMGFNMLRKHIKVEPLLWYHYCDVYGIIVWQDMVNGGGHYGLEVNVIPFFGININDKHYRIFKRSDKAMRDNYYVELKEMINHLYNSPCIAMWVPFNEGWGQFDSPKAYALIKDMDKTRLVDSASGWHDMKVSDVISKHIYFTPIIVRKGNRAYVLSEFGGFSKKTKGHTFNNKMFGYKIYSTEESLTKAYKHMYEKTIIPQIKKGLSATVYTQLTDVEDELNGLFTYDRCVCKIPVEVLQEINAKVKY